jgi:hypothetical protein
VESDPIGLRSGFDTYSYVGASPLFFVDPYGLDFVDWIKGRLQGWLGGKVKQTEVDAVGRILGAKCAQNCQRFRAPRDKAEIATDICIDLQPGVQADIYTGNKVLQSCVKNCLEFVAKECPCAKGH